MARSRGVDVGIFLKLQDMLISVKDISFDVCCRAKYFRRNADNFNLANFLAQGNAVVYLDIIDPSEPCVQQYRLPWSARQQDRAPVPAPVELGLTNGTPADLGLVYNELVLWVSCNELQAPATRWIEDNLQFIDIVFPCIAKELTDIDAMLDKHVVRLENNPAVKPNSRKGIEPNKPCKDRSHALRGNAAKDALRPNA